MRIELYPNYNKRNEEETFYHPSYFMDSLETARRERCHFLCIDAKAPLFFPSDANYFVNIMSLVHREEGERSSVLVAKLLAHNVTFINFRADDIIYSLVNGIDEMVIGKFFSVECNCDFVSFISVYRIAIIKLLSFSYGKAQMDAFLIQICKQIDRTFSRARMYQWRAEKYQDMNMFTKYEYYAKYNISLLIMLHETLIENVDLWKKIARYPYRYFDIQILEKLSNALLRNEEVNNLEVMKGLLNFYSFPMDK